MDAILCLRDSSYFQSMELERPEAICGLESGTRSRLWSTRGDCACRQDVAFFGLRLAETEIACLNQFSSVFSWQQICWHRGDHESNVCVVLTAEFQPTARNPVGGMHGRHAEHYRRVGRLRVFGTPADAVTARDRRRRGRET